MSEKSHPTLMGYGHPPVHSRFKPGQSGNPKGRPKKPPSLRADLAEVLSELVPTGEGADAICITRQRALLKKLVAMGLEGDMKALNSILALSSQEPEEQRSEEPDPIDQELLDNYAPTVEPVALPSPGTCSKGGK